jgi:hypothetical protein
LSEFSKCPTQILNSNIPKLIYLHKVFDDETIAECYERLMKASYDDTSVEIEDRGNKFDKPIMPAELDSSEDPNSNSDIIFIGDSGSEFPENAPVFTMYKRVDKKVKPVSGTSPQQA